MKKLYFIRHGLSEMNVKQLISGHTDTILTSEGRKQAKKAGQAAKGLNIDLIVSSPLLRALETAQIIAREIGYPEEKIITDPRLMERNFGELEGTPYGVRRADYSKIKGAETDEMLVARAQAVIDWINELPNDHILIVAHGAIGRAIRSIVKTEYPMSHKEYINNAEILAFVEEN